MDLTTYKELFEHEFEDDIRPHLNFYSMIKTNVEKYDYSLNEELFFGISPPIEIYNEKESLIVTVAPNKIKTLYLSYLTLDTKFEEVPAETFVEIGNNKLFYIDLGITTNETLEVIPFIIHYDKKGKKKMTRVTLRNQLIRVAEDEIKLRLTFKIKGNGDFTINNISRTNLGVENNEEY